MPDLQFLNNVSIQGNETVHGDELITGNETVSGNSYVTENLTISGTTLALDTINLSGNFNATGDENISGNLNVGGVANFAQNINVLSGISTTGNVVASAFYGDGSNLTGIASVSSYLPLSGGNMSGPIAFGPYAYSPRIDQGHYDASRGGLSGLSLVCSVDYDFNWQAGWITALEQDRLTPRPLYVDGGAGTPVKVWNSGDNTGVVVAHTGITFPDGTVQTSASALSSIDVWDATYSTVCANSAQWSVTIDDTKLPLSGGTLTGSVSAVSFSGVHHGDGSFLTDINANNISSGTLSAARLPAFVGDVTTTTGSSSATVVKLQGYSVSTAAPSAGQMLQWNGTAWVPGSVPTGGSGGGGIAYFFNYGTASDAHPGLSGTVYELGRSTFTPTTSTTLTNVAENVYTPVAAFITDILDPVITQIPAGLWDANVWVSTTASNTTQMILKVDVYTYNASLSTTTLIATSDDLDIYDPSVIAQYTPSISVPQTTVSLNDRIYVVLKVKATSPNKNVTLYFGGLRPSHIHTTIPSVGGSGLVKVINGVFQTPASLLVDVDVAENAQIAQSKIASLTADLDSKFDKAGGTVAGSLTVTGTFSTINTDDWQRTFNTVQSTSASWSSVYNTVNSNSATYVTLTDAQTLTNKTVVDWMTLVRGYKTTPVLSAYVTDLSANVYSYTFATTGSDVTYYRYIKDDNSEDAFYTYFSGVSTLSGLVATKAIIL